MRTLGITAAILTGVLAYKVLHEVQERFVQANDLRMRFISTKTEYKRKVFEKADIFAKAESGEVRFEKLDA